MAFPYLHHSNFDDGTAQNFDSETDASAILDFPDYRDLARGGFSPWQGGHAMRVRLSGTAVAYLTETGDWDTAASGTISTWFSLCIGADLSLTASDAVILAALDSAGPVNETVFGVRNNAGVYELFAGETGATRTLPITPNNKTWYQVELVNLIDSGAPNDGTLAVYVNGAQLGATITGLDQAAITQFRLGAVVNTAAGNAGTLLFGAIIADDLRVYPRERFGVDTEWVTRDRVAFIGAGELDSISLTGTGTDAVLTLLDTDIYTATGTNFSREPLVYIRNVTANDQSPGMNAPVKFARGCYVQLTGTNPQAFLRLSCGGIVRSSANYVDRGRRM